MEHQGLSLGLRETVTVDAIDSARRCKIMAKASNDEIW